MIEITDAIVDRFCAVHAEYYDGSKVNFPLPRNVVRMLLERAIEPQPEITVTDEMHTAGVAEWTAWLKEQPTQTWPSCIARVYRAMRRLEPSKEPLPGAGLLQRRIGSDLRVAPYVVDGTPMRRQGGDRRKDGTE